MLRISLFALGAIALACAACTSTGARERGAARGPVRVDQPPQIAADPQSEVAYAQPVHPLIVVELPNHAGEPATIHTVADPLLHPSTVEQPAATVAQPVVIHQQISATQAATAPATQPAATRTH